jgi:hypothetical protein
MNRILFGLICGVLAGGIDITPMALQHLPWIANLSALIFWIVTGFLIAVTEINVAPALKGILIALMTLAPTAIIVGAKEPASLIPMSVATVVLGGALGFLIPKLANTKK